MIGSTRYHYQLREKFERGARCDLITPGHYNSQATATTTSRFSATTCPNESRPTLTEPCKIVSENGDDNDLFITDPDAIRQQFNLMDIPVKLRIPEHAGTTVFPLREVQPGE